MRLSSLLDVEWLLSTLFDASLLMTLGRLIWRLFFWLIHSVNLNVKLTQRVQLRGARFALDAGDRAGRFASAQFELNSCFQEALT